MGNEIIDVIVKDVGFGADHGIRVKYQGGGTEPAGAYMTKQEANKVCRKFQDLRKEGTRFFRCYSGTSGYHIKGHHNLNFVIDFADILEEES